MGVARYSRTTFQARSGRRAFNPLHQLGTAVRFAAYKIAFVLALIGSSLDGGLLEDAFGSSAEVLEVTREVVCAAPFAPGRPGADRVGWVGAISPALLVRHPPAAVLPTRPTHSLPNGLPAPLLC